MNVLQELRNVGYRQAAKAPPIPVVLPGLGQVGHVEKQRGLYLNSALERHVKALMRDHYRAERAARELTSGRFGAGELLNIAKLGTDSTDAIRAIKGATAAIASWGDLMTAYDAGKHWEYIGVKQSLVFTANTWSSLLRAPGNPGALGAYGTAAPPSYSSDTAGAFPLPMALGATDNLYLTNVGVNQGTGTNITLLVDLLQAVGGLATASSLTHNCTTTTMPRWTGGSGLQISMEIVVQDAGGSVATATFNYVNQSGTPVNSVATSIDEQRAVGSLMDGSATAIRFAAGDYGVRSLNTIVGTATAGSSSTWAALIYKPLILIPTLSTLSWTDRRDNVQIGGLRQLTEVAQGSKPCLGFFVLPSGVGVGGQQYLIETIWG